ncbi:hypothetical protein Tco_0312528, partial [Tanacetum coccineum]
MYLPQTNNQLRTSSNPRNQATVQDGRVVVDLDHLVNYDNDNDVDDLGYESKVKSAAAKMMRSKSVYQYTMGRGGYANVKQKMIENKEIEPDEEPARGTLWLKGRVNKDEEYPNDEIRLVGDK